MGNRVALFVFGALVALVLMAGCGPGKYVPKPNEEIHGTWINKEARPQKIVIDQTGSKSYTLQSDPAPTYTYGQAEELGKWKDAEGNIWYKSFFAMVAGSYKGMKFTELDKLSKSATVWEFVWRYYNRGEGEKPIYPAKIDPTDKNYGIYYRAKE